MGNLCSLCFKERVRFDTLDSPSAPYDAPTAPPIQTFIDTERRILNHK